MENKINATLVTKNMNQIEVKQAIAAYWFESIGNPPRPDQIDILFKNASLAVQDEYMKLVLAKAKEIIDSKDG